MKLFFFINATFALVFFMGNHDSRYLLMELEVPGADSVSYPADSGSYPGGLGKMHFLYKVGQGIQHSIIS